MLRRKRDALDALFFLPIACLCIVLVIAVLMLLWLYVREFAESHPTIFIIGCIIIGIAIAVILYFVIKKKIAKHKNEQEVFRLQAERTRADIEREKLNNEMLRNQITAESERGLPNTCPSCGAQLNDNPRFCQYCGTRILKQRE